MPISRGATASTRSAARRFSARLAQGDEAGLLDLPPPAAVLTVEQIAYDAQNTPINLTFSTHHPQRYPLRLDQDGQARR